ncbi:MAG: hypothetical protein NTW96_07285 [Planctomycetia bacterium]|nr:hypothetical protein [Planctomycetia bacterium]
MAKLLLECEANPSVESGVHTVVSIIDEYLVFAQKHVAGSTFYEQKLYLQEFCKTYGARRIQECIPYHLTKWVDSHPKWESAWTRAYAIRSLYTFDFKVKSGAENESSWSPKSGRPRVSICRGLLDHLRWQMRVPLNGTNGLR